MLDGTYNDFLVEESVHMLHQTVWFKKKVISEFTPCPHEVDDDYDDYHEQLQYIHGGALEDEEEHAYFHDVADGLRARRGGRRSIGNRTWGSGGIVNVGRYQARARLPAPRTPPAAMGKSSKHFSAAGSSAAASSSAVISASPEGSEGGNGSSGGSSGKRAMKKAEKALQKESQRERRREMVQVSRGSSR